MEKSEGGHFPPKMAESEPASVQVETDNPAKKLARQLDFTGGVPGQALTVSLPEHANQIIQPEVIKSSQLTVSMKSTQLIRPQPQLQQHILLMPMQQAPVLPPQPLIRPLSRQSSSEAKDGTPKKPKQCNCKHSRCLKLYCECFASGIFCDGCNCANCHNNVENEASRREAVEATLERNPNAFRPKIASSPHGTREKREDAGDGLVLPKHNKGCHCKKSGCLKKYCECFQANILCSENCKCMDCKNFEGSEERQALLHGDHANNMSYLQQAANAAITDAIGSSGYGSPPVNKNRKPQELFSGSMIKDPVHRLGQFQQENQIKASVPPSLLSSIPGPRVSNAAALGPPKVTYRSLLADIIQNHDIKELCSVLIVYAQEAAKMLSGLYKPIPILTTLSSHLHRRWGCLVIPTHPVSSQLRPLVVEIHPFQQTVLHLLEFKKANQQQDHHASMVNTVAGGKQKMQDFIIGKDLSYDTSSWKAPKSPMPRLTRKEDHPKEER
ncbi:hypothetical protein MTR67_030759 [Solanum verrucosum]|uniref:CRC domain-containing protein n=1 Tax=Solanum verrucosum TaxID=315347 RepID=A0AAF0U178_SOLVR|nr:hypothetical protein MTR67_030759 [Solanum verrucosum]